MPDSTDLRPASPPATSGAVGAARILVLAYGFFTLAAGARSGVQLATRYSHAPVAYLLSAVAASIYFVGMIAMLAAERAPARRLCARRVCLVELAGVMIIGTASLVFPDAFPDATVWSTFGIGYAFVPVALPLCALFWTLRTSCTP